MSDHELLSLMLGLPHALRLSKREQRGFVGMFPRSVLTEKQSAWVRGVAARLKIAVWAEGPEGKANGD